MTDEDPLRAPAGASGYAFHGGRYGYLGQAVLGHEAEQAAKRRLELANALWQRGPGAIACFLRDVEAGADVTETLERYARISLANSPAFVLIKGGRK